MAEISETCLSFSEGNHEVFVNVDFWYMPCNYSIVNAPVVLAVFVEGQTCQLDTALNVNGGKRERKRKLGLFCSPFFFFTLQMPSCTLVL